MKKIIAIILIPLLAACGGTNLKRVTTDGQVWIDNDTKYYVENVDIKLKSVCPRGEEYQSAEDVSKAFASKVKQYVCELGNCADSKKGNNVVLVTVDGNFERILMDQESDGTCPYRGYAGGRLNFSYSLKKDGVDGFSAQSEPHLEAKRSMFGNLSRIAAKLSFTGGHDHEMNDIDSMSKGIAESIISDDKFEYSNIIIVR